MLPVKCMMVALLLGAFPLRLPIGAGCIAGIFVGMAGQDTAMGLEFDCSSQRQHDGLTEEEWKRATYPAGRIMHLVPAHLIPGAPGQCGESCCTRPSRLSCMVILRLRA